MLISNTYLIIINFSKLINLSNFKNIIYWNIKLNLNIKTTDLIILFIIIIFKINRIF